MGTSLYQILQQAVEPHLPIQAIGPIPMRLLIGCCGCFGHAAASGRISSIIMDQ